MFKTLGDMFAPGNLPDINPVSKLNQLPDEPQDTWMCRRCDIECAGERGIGVCLSCEIALRRSTDDRDSRLKEELEKLDEYESKHDPDGDYDDLRDIQDRIEADRHRRDEDWQREYTHFSNFD